MAAKTTYKSGKKFFLFKTKVLDKKKKKKKIARGHFFVEN